MGATAQTVTSAGVLQGLSLMYGSWTAESTKGDHVITCPRHVAFIMVIADSGGTSPNILMKHVSETDESVLITGTTGVITSPADSAGIAITNNATGTCTINVDSTSFVNSGTNQWFVIAKA